MNDCGLRGLALLDAAIAQIEAHPETWNQEVYRCGTGMCVAGWICELAGGRWLEGADGIAPDALEPESYDESWLISQWHGRAAVNAPDRACTLLGTRDIFSVGPLGASLFSGLNSLADIKTIRDELAARGEVK